MTKKKPLMDEERKIRNISDYIFDCTNRLQLTADLLSYLGRNKDDFVDSAKNTVPIIVYMYDVYSRDTIVVLGNIVEILSTMDFTKNKMKKHLVIATYDGIGTHYSGVGTIAKNIVDSLSEMAEAKDFKVSIAYVNVDKTSSVFNKDCFNLATKLTKNTGGYMVLLCNTTKGQSEWDMWRSFDEWKYSCVSLVTALNIILNLDDENYIILNDTPFLFFAKYKELVHDKNIKCFYFPLSTGKNHAFGDEEWRNNRIEAEKNALI